MADARERLLDVIHFAECANQGTTPDALLDAYKREVLTESARISAQEMEGLLRAVMADEDYDHHKAIECGEDDGENHYPELAVRWADWFNRTYAKED